MELNEIIALDKKYFMNTFGDRQPVCFVRGEGMKLWDTEGKVYMDFLAGIAVSALGHSHPALVHAITEQAQKFIHCSNYYYIEPQAKLAQLIVENSCCTPAILTDVTAVPGREDRSTLRRELPKVVP